MANSRCTYKTEAAHDTHTFTWEINNFGDALKNKIIREYRTKKSLLHSGPHIKLDLLCENHDVIKLYVLFSTEVSVKFFLKLDQHEIVKGTQFENVQINKWLPLCELQRKNFIDMYGSIIRRNVLFYMKFETCKQNSNQLKLNLEKGFDTGDFSDAVIKSNEGKEFKVHKVILACRSPVLKAHFDHDTTECHTNVVEAPFESEVVEEVLSYIYSEKVTRIEDLPEKILAAADYYQLNELKTLCGYEMSKQLSVENVLETLELAMLYRVDSLKRSALEFIRDDNAGLITQSEFWDNNISVDVLKTIYEYIHPRTDKLIEYFDVKQE